MEITYTVSGMSCGHCKAAVEEEVGRVPGVEFGERRRGQQARRRARRAARGRGPARGDRRGRLRSGVTRVALFVAGLAGIFLVALAARQRAIDLEDRTLGEEAHAAAAERARRSRARGARARAGRLPARCRSATRSPPAVVEPYVFRIFGPDGVGAPRLRRRARAPPAPRSSSAARRRPVPPPASAAARRRRVDGADDAPGERVVPRLRRLHDRRREADARDRPSQATAGPTVRRRGGTRATTSSCSEAGRPAGLRRPRRRQPGEDERYLGAARPSRRAARGRPRVHPRPRRRGRARVRRAVPERRAATGSTSSSRSAAASRPVSHEVERGERPEGSSCRSRG